MIKVEGLSKKYNSVAGEIVALKDINLHVKKGEIAGIIGFSGAGKSTLVRCINLLEKPSAGHVYVDGQEITGLKGAQLRELRQKIGMIFQHFNLLASRKVRENIAFPLEIAGWPKDKINKRVDELLELVGLTGRVDAYPSQLSGGQKQRVGIARALANEPKILLCDEATSALDPSTTQSILALLKEINKKLGLTILIITHEMQVIKEICDKVWVIEKGQIIESGPVLEVFAHPQQKATKGFTDSIHRLEIPADFYRQVASSPGYHQLVRLIFTGGSAGQPIVASLPQNFGVNVNIMAGNIDYIKGQPLGILTLDISGDKDAVIKCLEHLEKLDLTVEVQDVGF